MYSPNGEMPLVSVIVLTYNGEAYLEAQLDSILGQTYSHTEIIISDDGSDDSTCEIAARYASDSRVRLERNTGERGVAANLESALHKARGEFVAISDQDDIWELEKLACLLEAVRGLSGAFSDSALINADGIDSGLSMVGHLGWNSVDIGTRYLRLMIDNCVSGHALLIERKAALSVLPFEAYPVYDQQLALAAAYHEGLAYVPRCLVRHRQHGGNNNNRIFAGSPDKLPVGNRNQLSFARLHSMLRVLTVKLAGEGRGLPAVKGWCLRRLYKRIGATSRNDFKWAAFCLMWPYRRDLLFASRGKFKTLRLYKLCRAGTSV